MKRYATPINKWFKYCEGKSLDPLNASFVEGVEFLADMFNTTTSGYSTLNTARSALSVIFKPIEGVTFGRHPLVARLLKGMFKRRPSLPRYTVTYDITIILNYMTTMAPNRDNSLELHTYKLATLMCLLSGQRAQTLGSLKLEDMHLDEEKCVFYISSLMKQSRPKFHPAPLEFLAFSKNDNICVVQCITDYLERTKELRKNMSLGGFFVSFAKPHKVISSRTISRYVCKFLKLVGIDIKTFKGHSTRSAATSAAAAKGLSLTEVSRAAGWSNASTFRDHYHKPIKENFGDIILQKTDL